MDNVCIGVLFSMKIFENPDKKLVKDIRKQLKENDGYCPCYLIHDKEHKCMCKNFREQAEPGYCH